MENYDRMLALGYLGFGTRSQFVDHGFLNQEWIERITVTAYAGDLVIVLEPMDLRGLMF